MTNQSKKRMDATKKTLVTSQVKGVTYQQELNKKFFKDGGTMQPPPTGDSGFKV